MFKKAVIGALVLVLMLGPSAFATKRVVPHLTPLQGPFASSLTLHNQSDQPQAYTLRPYAEQGQALTAISSELGPGESLTLTVDQLGSQASYLFLDAPDSVSADMNFGRSSTMDLQVPVTEAATFWSTTTNWSANPGHMVLVNQGEKTTEVWIHQRNSEGNIVASQRLSKALAPAAKLKTILQPISFKSLDDSTFEITSDQKIAVLSLRTDDNGSLVLNQLTPKRTAESSRDEVGVWYITGGTLSDVFEMMGYNVATDRLWQGELYRRLSQGTLAEVLGPDLVNQDLQIRTVGYATAEYQSTYNAMSEEEKTVISSYVAGFNRRIAEVRADQTLMPFELVALGLTDVADWQPWHVLAWAVTLQQQFTSGFGAFYQVAAAAGLQDLVRRNGTIEGASMFNDLYWFNDPSAPTMVPHSQTANKKVPKAPLLTIREDIPDLSATAASWQERQATNEALLKKIGAYVKGGSYAWVVAGSKTHSGNPILFSGPQLEDARNFSAPGVVQEGSIRGGGIEVSGLAITGIPAIIVGRTPHHAWSFQVGAANSQDLYFDTPANIIGQRLETIKVAGAADVVAPVFTSVHGPIINAEPLISLKSAMRNYDFGFVKATLGLARAQNMDQFGEAVAELAVSMHICYADKDKNIAYWHSGRTPIRPKGSWILPQGTTAPPLEWDTTKILPLVHDRNTPQGFYGGWNNKPSADFTDLSGTFRDFAYHPADVITDYLEANDHMTFDEVAAISPRIAHTYGRYGAGQPWKHFKDAFTAAVQAHPTPARTEALNLMSEWNGITVEGPEAGWPYNMNHQDAHVLQETWMTNVLGMTFNDELGTNIWFNFSRNRMGVLYHLLNPDESIPANYNWFRNRAGTGPDGASAVILAALDKTLADLGPKPWGTNDRVVTRYNHALFGNLVDLIPQLATPYSDRATYAQCIEYGPEGPIQIGSHFLLGQSGAVKYESGFPILDPNSFTMMPYFLTFNLRPFPLFD